eukprot:3573812-Rhodomonas_salina.1
MTKSTGLREKEGGRCSETAYTADHPRGVCCRLMLNTLSSVTIQKFFRDAAANFRLRLALTCSAVCRSVFARPVCMS